MTVDTDLLALLEAVPGLNVHDGEVGADELKVISVPVPYIVYSSSPGYDNNKRHSGGAAGRVVQVRIKGVGQDPREAKWALDQARAVLSRKRLNGYLIVRTDDDEPTIRDNEYTRPGGGALFYGVDKYAVATSTS